MSARQIQIDFPCDVEFPEGFERALNDLVDTVCKKYEAEHPDRVMWPFGQGSLMLSNPFMVDDEHPLEFDDSVYHIEVAERERYEGDSK